MIEIAISLAIIGFALVAIIGILPTGMNVQKANRQETIINQDATIWLDAIRNGARGLDDLTNYVLAITNVQVQYQTNGTVVGSHVWAYTVTNSILDTGPSPIPFPLTNGFRIVGLLSTPRFTPANSLGDFFSNHLIAVVRSMSGPASEKFPQTNSVVQDLGLSYRLICEVNPYSTNYFNPLWTNFTQQVLPPSNPGTPEYPAYQAEVLRRSNYMRLVWAYQTNLHDLRLTFRWPLLPNGDVPGSASRQSYRTLVSGAILNTNDWLDWANGVAIPLTNLYFFQPRTFVSHKDT